MFVSNYILLLLNTLAPFTVMRFELLPPVVALLSFGSFVAAGSAATEFAFKTATTSASTTPADVFSTPNNNNKQEKMKEGLRYLRTPGSTTAKKTTTNAVVDRLPPPTAVATAGAAVTTTTSNTAQQHLTQEEDILFWSRLLTNEELGSMPTPSPTEAPPTCPVNVEITCVSLTDSSLSCTDIEPPTDQNSTDCLVDVEYTYTMVNDGPDVQRIYSLVITQGGTVLDVSGSLGSTADVQPGGTFIVVQGAQINICQGDNSDDDDSPFTTEAAFTTGPPCDVEITIACVATGGVECRELPVIPGDTPPDECLIDVTYTYTVENTGNVDANIIELTRTRNGMVVDLIDLLPTTSLNVTETVIITETEEISLCIAQLFTTNALVRQVPNADLLCDDVGFYP